VLSAGAAFFPGTSELWLIGAHPDRKLRIEPEALAEMLSRWGLRMGEMRR